MKYSVLIPTYNAETTIERCLDSLPLNRDDLEVIIMDDGSTDNIENKLKKYKINFIKKENTKVADTRNKLIKKAKGKYIMFIDSDDYINKNLFVELDKLLEIEKKIDVISFGIDLVNEQQEKIGEYRKLDTLVTTGENLINTYIKNKITFDTPVGYLYKRSFFTKNKFTYPVGYNHEDYAITPIILIKASKVISLSDNYYYYVQTENSIVRGDYQKKKRNIQDLLYHSKNHLKFIKKEKLTEDTKKYFSSYIANTLILQINNLIGKDKAKYIKQLKKSNISNYLCSDNIKQKLKKFYYKRFIIK